MYCITSTSVQYLYRQTKIGKKKKRNIAHYFLENNFPIKHDLGRTLFLKKYNWQRKRVVYAFNFY